MANTSARMLALLSLLQTHRFWPGIELAQRLEVSERTLRRDVERLRDLGYPVDASRGVAGGYQLRSGAAMPPLLLDDEEAVAIAVGLRAATGFAGIEEISLRALTKVIAVLPARLRRRVDALRSHAAPASVSVSVSVSDGQTFDLVVLTLLAQACRDNERLRFDYTSRDGAAALGMSSQTTWFACAGTGICSPGTLSVTTGGPFGSTGSARRVRPVRGFANAHYPVGTPRSTSAIASRRRRLGTRSRSSSTSRLTPLGAWSHKPAGPSNPSTMTHAA
jgi:biotin operon repressor